MLVTKITSGPNIGYYSIPSKVNTGSPLYNERESGLREMAGGRGLAWYKYSPGPGKTIRGFNTDYLPYIDGYYYVAKDPMINLRRQLYALENNLVPSDGNTELFNLQLNKVIVPSEWCPYYLDPCPSNDLDCTRCQNRITAPIRYNTSGPTSFNLGATLARWLYLFVFSVVVAMLLSLIVLS